jgi:hypothetical protein
MMELTSTKTRRRIIDANLQCRTGANPAMSNTTNERHCFQQENTNTWLRRCHQEPGSRLETVVSTECEREANKVGLKTDERKTK